MYRYAITIFLSAFLLFQIQPMIAKFILPWYGGSSAVWTTCMMYFQTVLLLGYLYSHLIRRTLSPRAIWIVHLILLALAALTLKTAPPEFLRPTGGENLTWAIVRLLTYTVGLPFLMLSTTGPLVQAWHSLSHGGKTYRLYAISNLGSILALVTYPFLFERVFPLGQQTSIWVMGFLVFAAFCSWSGWQTIKYGHWSENIRDEPVVHEDAGFGLGRIMLWLVLAMAPSIMLLATTNMMCQEVASVPFLWILPLGLYLVSLIICFDRPALYKRRIFTPLLLFSAIAGVLVVQLNNKMELLPQIIGLAAVCFTCSMTCHGELERLKPSPRHLTLFYLVMSLGGALGGIFVVVVAPQIFLDFYEFHIGLLASLVVPIAIHVHSKLHLPFATRVRAYLVGFTALITATFVGCSLYYYVDGRQQDGLIERVRSEYGLVSVKERDNYLMMVNGRTEHGGQYMDSDRQFEPSSYYDQGSGVSVSINSYRKFQDDLRDDKTTVKSGLNIGIVGLGTGSMVTWGESDDRFWFYEINPDVELLARKHFTYLESWGSKVQVVIGDGRVQLEKELREQGSKQFDILFIDAFTSDSIPAHLLTSECFDLYLQHLKSNGIIAAHISNRYVDLRPVVFELANSHGLTPILIERQSTETQSGVRWVLMTKNQSVLNSSFVKNEGVPWPKNMKSIKWTDDFASLSQLVDWSLAIDWEEIRRSMNQSRNKKSSKSAAAK